MAASRYFEPELVHLTGEKKSKDGKPGLWRLRTVAKTRKLTRSELIRFGAIKARLKSIEVGLQVAARRPKSLGGGWDVRVRKDGVQLKATRHERFQLAYNCRNGISKGGHASDYKHDTPKAGAAKAVRAALSQVGTHESPYGSNWGPPSKYIRAIGWNSPIPWCGAFLGWCLKQAGVKGITSECASVYAIYQNAGAGRGGFAKRVNKYQARPGDAVGLFGLSTHVEIVVANHGSYLSTVGGNTSSASGGSQSNGGMVARRTRSIGSVVYCARPKY